MNSGITVDVWSDFVCPWCFLASTSLKKLEESHGVTIQWRSFELRPEGSPPMPDWYKQRIINSRPQFEAMAKTHYGIEINAGPFGINSRASLIGMKYAEQHGKGAEYHDRVFRAYWEKAQNIADIEVLRAIVGDLGMDADEFEQALSDVKLEADVVSDIQTANYFNITGVPAMLFMNKYLINGAQPYDELVRVVDQITDREQL